MDVLSDVITTMRTGLPHSARVDRGAPFGRRFPSGDAAGFHVVLQGTAWLIPDNGDPVSLGPGDVVFLPRGAGHGLADSPSTPLADGPASSAQPRSGSQETPVPGAAPVTVMLCGAYLLDRSRTHPLLRELPDVVHLPARAGRRPHLRAALDLLGGELEGVRPGCDAMVPALLDVLLLHILRAWFEEREDAPTGWTAALNDPPVAAALRAMHGEPQRQWSVQELAGHAGLSRAAFARRFTTLVGQPPLAYLTWWRMTVAARLLRASDVPANAVAGKVGYTSEYAFAHAFKRAYGRPPGAYRREGRHRQAPTS
ncbi:AraC family transcriptional regulator [Microbispora corallina]|uniref:AraC family transcriptional regulator n=1 Tax=Microbispora corallina TaxID=83302 RepID=A0ABQ4G587_9ACTN|nr:AraC family transcriptional regulator [Microbispora corallina]GIH42202.1 AraC family transcriptional regulator [Microbispora corallina]